MVDIMEQFKSLCEFAGVSKSGTIVGRRLPENYTSSDEVCSLNSFSLYSFSDLVIGRHVQAAYRMVDVRGIDSTFIKPSYCTIYKDDDSKLIDLIPLIHHVVIDRAFEVVTKKRLVHYMHRASVRKNSIPGYESVIELIKYWCMSNKIYDVLSLSIQSLLRVWKHEESQLTAALLKLTTRQCMYSPAFLVDVHGITHTSNFTDYLNTYSGINSNSMISRGCCSCRSLWQSLNDANYATYREYYLSFRDLTVCDNCRHSQCDLVINGIAVPPDDIINLELLDSNGTIRYGDGSILNPDQRLSNKNLYYRRLIYFASHANETVYNNVFSRILFGVHHRTSHERTNLWRLCASENRQVEEYAVRYPTRSEVNYMCHHFGFTFVKALYYLLFGTIQEIDGVESDEVCDFPYTLDNNVRLSDIPQYLRSASNFYVFSHQLLVDNSAFAGRHKLIFVPFTAQGYIDNQVCNNSTVAFRYNYDYSNYIPGACHNMDTLTLNRPRESDGSYSIPRGTLELEDYARRVRRQTYDNIVTVTASQPLPVNDELYRYFFRSPMPVNVSNPMVREHHDTFLTRDSRIANMRSRMKLISADDGAIYGENNSCSICYNDIYSIDSYSVVDKSNAEFICKHGFHSQCLTSWFELYNHAEGCPVCRSNFL